MRGEVNQEQGKGKEEGKNSEEKKTTKLIPFEMKRALQNKGNLKFSRGGWGWGGAEGGI